MMQILESGGIPLCIDNSRPPDENNPKGYYETFSGKIISKILAKSVNLKEYKGKFIKITSYGLQFLPPGDYKIIYMERDLTEVLKSMEIMTKNKFEDFQKGLRIFGRFNDKIKDELGKRMDVDYLIVNYNRLLKNPLNEINKINEFLGIKPSIETIGDMVSTVDKSLYRVRK